MDIEPMTGGYLPRDILRQLSRRSDARGLLQLAMHMALLCATSFFIFSSRGRPWLPVAMVLHGIVLSFLFCAQHECIHRTAFQRRWLNDAVAWVCGTLLVLPPEYFRLFHFAHHRFTQDPLRDPELADSGAMTPWTWLWRICGIPYWRDRLTVTLTHALTGRVRESFVPPEKRRRVVHEARLLWTWYLCVLVISVCLHRSEALIYWILPAFLGQPFLRLFLLAEHSGCALSADMLENTRTTRTNAAVRALSWRMPYHAEHHCFPSVPFHSLPALHALIGPRVRVTSSGYLALHVALLRGRSAVI
ncbi:MAG: fatty acid desaturase [Sinobacteraceae bacterium]|nr:fatty acid desaturase [Nevskiaceae bacterium]